MNSTRTIRAALLALCLAMPVTASAQNVAAPTNLQTPSPVDEDEAPAPAVPDPANSIAREPTVTPPPIPVPAPAETIEPEIINPYANSYNDLLPIEEEQAVEEEGGFDWGLLGLLGLIGLFGLKRRDRIVYAERVERDRYERRD